MMMMLQSLTLLLLRHPQATKGFTVISAGSKYARKIRALAPATSCFDNAHTTSAKHSLYQLSAMCSDDGHSDGVVPVAADTIAAAQKAVSAAEVQLTAAKEEVESVAAKVEAAKEDYEAVPHENTDKKVYLEAWKSALADKASARALFDSAIKGFDSATECLVAARQETQPTKSATNLEPNATSSFYESNPADSITTVEPTDDESLSELPWNDPTCTSAKDEAQLEILKWASENGCSDDRVYTIAAENGHLEKLKVARDNGCPWGVWVSINATNSDHLGEVLQWTRELARKDGRACCVAASNGHLEVLNWARVNGCPWGVWVGIDASDDDKLDVLQWARKWTKENGLSWGAELCDGASINLTYLGDDQ